MHQHRHAGHVAQFALQAVKLVPVVHGHAPGQCDPAIAIRLVCGDYNFFHAFAQHLLTDTGNGNGSIDRLATRHCNGIIEQYFVGDVGIRGHRLPDGKVAGMKVCAFAHVLKNMRHAGKARHAYPVRTFTAHLRQSRRVAVHPGGHVMAAYAAQGLAALRHFGGRAVRAAGTEVGAAAKPMSHGSGHEPLVRGCGSYGRYGSQCGEPSFQCCGDQGWFQLADGRYQLLAVRIPFA